MDKVKALAYPILVLVLAFLWNEQNDRLKSLHADVKAIKAYVNYMKGQQGDKDLLVHYLPSSNKAAKHEPIMYVSKK